MKQRRHVLTEKRHRGEKSLHHDRPRRGSDWVCPVPLPPSWSSAASSEVVTGEVYRF
jgi:hypothetical protein